jgi:TolB-like protein/class 3 adenylate cyclase/tetratricopeptide (TPR) repeat protein
MATTNMADKRRLATILALDVAGYSRAAELDDEAAATSVRQLRAVIEEIVAPFGGRIFNSSGDGFMLEFPSAASGVQAAMALLTEAQTGARPLPKIRVGVHLGDVIVESNGDLLGHGVNVAARLQALAQPGTAIVSETVRAQVRSAAELPFASEGRVQLDKMTERMGVYSLNPAGAKGLGKLAQRRIWRIAAIAAVILVVAVSAAVWVVASAPRVSANPRIAVLKLESVGATEPFFAEGMTDELITELAQIKGLDVVARASSFALRPEEASPEHVAERLNATLVLGGSVRKVGDVIRVNAQLAEAPSGKQIWAEVYERPVSQVFALQRDIAVSIARVVNIRTVSAPTASVNPQAYELYLEGRTRMMKARDVKEFTAIRDLDKAATELDPQFARAWWALASAETEIVFTNAFFNDVAPTKEGMKAAFDDYDRALALDPGNPSIYYNRATAYFTLGMWKEAQASFDQASERGLYGGDWLFFAVLGYTADALAEAKDSARRDPLSLRHWTNLAQICADVADRKCQQDAIAHARELGPDDVVTNGYGYRALIDAKDFDGARKLLVDKRKPLDGFMEMNAPFDERYLKYLSGDGAAIPAEEISKAVQDGKGYVDPAIEMLVNMKDWDAAARMLEQWGATSRPALAYLYRDDWSPLRVRPEFWRLMEREGLASFWRETGKWPDFCKQPREKANCETHIKG